MTRLADLLARARLAEARRWSALHNRMSTLMAPDPLPVIGSQAPERADAARNRAEDPRRGAAGSSTGTGSRTSRWTCWPRRPASARARSSAASATARASRCALLDEHEQAFQEAFIRGEPPLGPGAPPVERLRAFGHAMIDLLEEHGDLILVGESGSPCARFRSPPFLAHRAHVHEPAGGARPAPRRRVPRRLAAGRARGRPVPPPAPGARDVASSACARAGTPSSRAVEALASR